MSSICAICLVRARAPSRCAGCGCDDLVQARFEFRWRIVECNTSECAALVGIKVPKPASTDLRGVLKDRLEHGFQVAWRGVDDLSTSAVAVCCCSDSRSSLSSRAFSIAITAWSAKILTNSICLSVNGFTVRPRQHEDADHNSIAQQRNTDIASVAAEFLSLSECVLRIGQNIRDVNDFAFQGRASGNGSAFGFESDFAWPIPRTRGKNHSLRLFCKVRRRLAEK